MHRIITLLSLVFLLTGHALSQSTMTFDAGFNADGVLDALEGAYVEDMAVMPDGKVVVAIAHRVSDPFDMYTYFRVSLYGLDANGDLDPAFNGGRPLTLMRSEQLWVSDLVVHGGRLYVCGRMQQSISSDPYPYVAVIGPDGAFDAGFGTDGIAVVEDFQFAPWGMAVTPSGRIYLCGSNMFGPEGVVARLDATGVLDSSWSADGIALVPAPAASHVVLEDVLVDMQQRVVVVGYEEHTTPNDETPLMVAAGFQADGTYDIGFSAGNVLRTGPPYALYGRGFEVLERPGGGYFLVGNAGAYRDDPCVLGLTASGTPDHGYGNAGWAVLPTPGAGMYAPACGSVLLPDGRLFVGGMYPRYDSSIVSGLLFTATGQLDGSFGVGGVANVLLPDVAGIYPSAACLASAPGGKLYVGGVIDVLPGTHPSLSRFSMDLLSPLWGSADEGDLLAYPNPAVSGGWVYLSGQTTGPLELFDARGRIVTRWPAAEGALELPALPAGVYLLRSGKLSQRLLVR